MKRFLNLLVVAALILNVSGHPTLEPTDDNEEDCHTAVTESIKPPQFRRMMSDEERTEQMESQAEASGISEATRRQKTQSLITMLENPKIDDKDPAFTRRDGNNGSSGQPSPKRDPARLQGRRVCFACSSASDLHCRYPNASITTVKYCPDDKQQCVVKTYGWGDTTILVRDCGRGCNCLSKEPLRAERCHACSSDLCNTATEQQLSAAAAAAASAALPSATAGLLLAFVALKYFH